jgi:hypothetical protein
VFRDQLLSVERGGATERGTPVAGEASRRPRSADG